MASHRFTKYRDDTMKKIFTLDSDQEHIYRISVPLEDWKDTNRKACNRWVQSMKKGNTTPFRWGSIEKIKNEEFHDPTQQICTFCKKTFKSKSGFSRHRKVCKESLNSKNEVAVIGEHPRKKTRPFGNENPKWLTSELLYGVLSNIHHAIPEMMRNKHFNDKFPENQNLRIDNHADIDSRMQVFEEGRWMVKGSRQTFYKVLVSICDILSEALEEEEEEDDKRDEEDHEDDGHIDREIRRLRNSERFVHKINQIRPLWDTLREKITDPEQRVDLWEDLKTLLLDRQLAVSQGFT